MPRSGIGLNDLLGRLQGSAGQHMRRPPRPKAQMSGRALMMPRESAALKRKASRKAVAARKNERSQADRETKDGITGNCQVTVHQMHGARSINTPLQMRSRTYSTKRPNA